MREQRLVFGEVAELYDQVRPSYPEQLVDDVVELVGVPARALDVGSGTGKAAVLLAARGLEGVALEPDPAMAAVARKRLLGFPGWRVEVGEFERWAPGPDVVPSESPSGSGTGAAGKPDAHRAQEREAGGAGEGFDLVSAAQAWHWLDPRTRSARAATLLRPGGWLARWWNRPAPDPNPLRYAIDRCYDRLAPTLGAHFMAPEGPPADAADSAGPGFDARIERHYAWSRTFTTGEWLDLLRTQSDHRLLPDEQREQLLAAVGEAIHAAGGSYEHYYVCWLFADRRSAHRATGS